MTVAGIGIYAGALVAALAVAAHAAAASSDASWNTCRVGKPSASIAACTDVIEGDQERSTAERAIAFYNRGNGYFNQGNLGKAIDDYTRSIALNPDFLNAHFNRGNGYFNSGDLDHAIAD
jgi:tetratricopeptide (TPR) repeat protein